VMKGVRACRSYPTRFRLPTPAAPFGLAFVFTAPTISYLLTRRHSEVASDNNSNQPWRPTGRIDFAGRSFNPAKGDIPAPL
jgi:hypothetical protein